MTEQLSATAKTVVFHPDEVAQLPWRDVPGWDAAFDRILWCDSGTGSNAGVLWLAPGAQHPRHQHRGAAHHVYVLSGSLHLGDDMLVRGGYAYVPAGTDHGPDVAGPEGCTLFFVYDVS